MNMAEYHKNNMAVDETCYILWVWLFATVHIQMALSGVIYVDTGLGLGLGLQLGLGLD